MPSSFLGTTRRGGEAIPRWSRGEEREGGAEGRAKPLQDKLPRITRLMALAIHFDPLIREGKVKDYTEIARLGGVTRARLTQVMNLLCLAPKLQEQLLLDVVTNGGERTLRQVTRVIE